MREVAMSANRIRSGIDSILRHPPPVDRWSTVWPKVADPQGKLGSG